VIVTSLTVASPTRLADDCDMAEIPETRAPEDRSEGARLEAVRRLGLLDRGPVPGLDGIVERVALACRAPCAFASVVDAVRQWSIAGFGEPLLTAESDRPLVVFAMNEPGLFVADDARAHPVLAAYPAIARHSVRLFASAPLVTADGFIVGALCVVDGAPRELSLGGRQALATGARAIAALVEQRAAMPPGAALTAPTDRDALTGLPGRSRFVECVTAEIAAEVAFGVVLIDVDALKVINDAYGYATGDAILVELGRRLRAAVRSEDTVVRSGGDEFAIVLRNMASSDDSAAIVDRIFAALQARIAVERAEHRIVANIGVTFVVDRAPTPETILGEAERALRGARRRGGGRAGYFNDAVDPR